MLFLKSGEWAVLRPASNESDARWGFLLQRAGSPRMTSVRRFLMEGLFIYATHDAARASCLLLRKRHWDEVDAEEERKVYKLCVS